MILSLKEFLARYVEPAAKGLAGKLNRSEPLTDDEFAIASAIINPQAPKAIIIGAKEKGRGK